MKESKLSADKPKSHNQSAKSGLASGSTHAADDIPILPKPVKARKKRSEGSRDDVVMRISRANHGRLKELLRASDETKEPSINELIERLLNAADAIKASESVYLFGMKVYTDPSVARGEAVMFAASNKIPVQWPAIAIVVGQDEP